MTKEQGYKITIGILSIIIVLLVTFIIFNIPRKPALKIPKIPKLTKAIKARIAVVIDDLGYNSNNLSILEDIKYPMTFSVLPGINYSGSLARELSQRGFEIILHLPLEPHENQAVENNTILTSMDEAKIKEIIDLDLSSIQFAKGVSNHMGSKATEDPKTMNIIFNELKNKHLYFLDSFVTGKSVGQELANKINIKFAKRDVFLDNVLDAKYIRQQIYQLKIKARQKGEAIGIGHDRKITLEILKEVMPELEKEGYKFVFVSELVK
jgi:hypothetical protein